MVVYFLYEKGACFDSGLWAQLFVGCGVACVVPGCGFVVGWFGCRVEELDECVHVARVSDVREAESVWWFLRGACGGDDRARRKG